MLILIRGRQQKKSAGSALPGESRREVCGGNSTERMGHQGAVWKVQMHSSESRCHPLLQSNASFWERDKNRMQEPMHLVTLPEEEPWDHTDFECGLEPWLGAGYPTNPVKEGTFLSPQPPTSAPDKAASWGQQRRQWLSGEWSGKFTRGKNLHCPLSVGLAGRVGMRLGTRLGLGVLLSPQPITGSGAPTAKAGRPQAAGSGNVCSLGGWGRLAGLTVDPLHPVTVEALCAVTVEEKKPRDVKYSEIKRKDFRVKCLFLT